MRKHLSRWLITYSFLLAACINAAAYEITGKVIKVTDGDTITLLDATKTKYKIRLADIDTPENGQPFGNKAKKFMASLAAGKSAVADCREKDRYRRDVCTVYVDGLDLNAEMIKSGHAWVYDKYNHRDDLPYLQKQAQQSQAGLWRLPEAQIVNPSDWRKGQRAVQEQVRAARAKQKNEADYTCGSKQYCKQMSSCDEAHFYFEQCGVVRLDGNNDGIPCNSLCC